MDTAVAEPEIIAKAECLQEYIEIPFIGYRMPETALGPLLVGMNAVSVFTVILFIVYVEILQEEYILEFKSQTVSMSDFAIRVKNLPKASTYGGDLDVLRAELWKFFQDLLVNQYKEDMDIQELDRIPRHCEIADITFAKQALDDTDILMKLYESSRKKKLYTMRLTKSKT